MSGDQPLTILHPLDLSIPSGQFVSVVGPSGSGKSTLLGLIAGLDSPTMGHIIVDGADITRLDEDQLAELRSRSIGFIFQFFHLIPSLTALENILVPLEITGVTNAEERAKDLLGHVDLNERGHHYPSQLSGGEQQRTAIARTLFHDPKIILADEPVSNLDTYYAGRILGLLRNKANQEGKIILCALHDPQLINRFADLALSLNPEHPEGWRLRKVHG